MDFSKIYAAVLALIFFAAPGFSRELTIHGPILQMHRDPLTEMTITWVEEISPESSAPAVWRDGPAGFGYGDDDDRTMLSDMRKNYERVYLSKTFNLASVPTTGDMQLIIRYDDAFACWINGTLVAKSDNLKGYHTAGKVKGGHEAKEAEVFNIPNPRRFLETGQNIVSIEGHNVRASSSDFTLDPVLMLGSKPIIARGAEWKYLASTDPPARWFLRDQSVSRKPELPKAEESEWSVGIRPRGSGARYAPVEVEERPFGETENPLFEAKVSGLSPGREYEYVLRAEGRQVRKGWFRTAPARLNRSLKFVTGGDMDLSGAIPISKVAGKQDPLFALVGGDLAYANGESAYNWYVWLDDWYEFLVSPDGRSIPIIAGIGNHEMKGLRIRKQDAPYYFSLFDLPNGESNFTVDFGNYMSIVLLDSNHAQRVKSQNLWLNLQLSTRDKVPHLFAMYHRPAWGTGVKRNIGDIQDDWSPLFEKYGVDCVFENDHHVYKRSKKLKDGLPNEAEGVLYIGDGAWGRGTRPITDRGLDRVGARQYLETWQSINHLIAVTIDPNGMKHYRAMSEGSNVFDSYDDRGTPTQAGGGLLEEVADEIVQ